MNSWKALLRDVRVIPVLAIEDVAQAEPLAEALLAGGLSVLEITFRTEAALDSIGRIKKNVPGVSIAAGTVLTPAQADQAVGAGVDFIVTPGLSPLLIAHILKGPVPVLPGVATASEIMTGLEFGLEFFKFFPAEVSGGIPALRAFGGPFPNLKFCPTGGVRESNLADYLRLSNVEAVGGTWLTPTSLIAENEWAEITTLAKTASNIANTVD